MLDPMKTIHSLLPLFKQLLEPVILSEANLFYKLRVLLKLLLMLRSFILLKLRNKCNSLWLKDVGNVG